MGSAARFKDWARSSTNYPDEVSELALAHVNSDATRAAYGSRRAAPEAHAAYAGLGEILGDRAETGERDADRAPSWLRARGRAQNGTSSGASSGCSLSQTARSTLTRARGCSTFCRPPLRARNVSRRFTQNKKPSPMAERNFSIACDVARHRHDGKKPLYELVANRWG